MDIMPNFTVPSFSVIVDAFIEQLVLREFKNQDLLPKIETSFENLISLGELVDRLSIVNIKLFVIKNFQKNCHDEKLLAQSAKDDVRLVEERARLKRCVDEKVIKMIHRALSGREDTGFNPEAKRYGIN
jgi:hypothetical protein